MIDIILDTDIGCDCDDAGALALLHQLENNDECKIKAVTSCSSRIDGVACIDAINKYYGKNIPVGMYKSSRFLEEENFGLYSREVAKSYENDYIDKEADDAVKVIRETLSSAQGKSIKLVFIGPLNNLANLLLSGKDPIINKTGVELVKEKVKEVVIMGGYFPLKDQKIYLGDTLVEAEWNILQDIKSAQIAVKNCPVDIVFCPFELGFIKTGSRLFTEGYNSPIRLSYEIHSNGLRESWDPITCYFAVRGLDNLWDMSKRGDVTVLDNGITQFNENPQGKHRYLMNKNNNQELVRQTIDNLIY